MAIRMNKQRITFRLLITLAFGLLVALINSPYSWGAFTTDSPERNYYLSGIYYFTIVATGFCVAIYASNFERTYTKTRWLKGAAYLLTLLGICNGFLSWTTQQTSVHSQDQIHQNAIFVQFVLSALLISVQFCLESKQDNRHPIGSNQ